MCSSIIDQIVSANDIELQADKSNKKIDLHKSWIIIHYVIFDTNGLYPEHLKCTCNVL